MIKVSPSEALRYNREMIEKLARHMGRLVQERLKKGDIMQVAFACEHLCGSGGNMIEFLSRCDATCWMDFIMITCTDICKDKYKYGGKTPSDLLKIATGKDRKEWLEVENTACRHPSMPY